MEAPKSQTNKKQRVEKEIDAEVANAASRPPVEGEQQRVLCSKGCGTWLLAGLSKYHLNEHYRSERCQTSRPVPRRNTLHNFYERQQQQPAEAAKPATVHPPQPALPPDGP
ncbi:hypothetical protein Agub_g15993, partial [Astrephomene gubernaculifera]